MLLVCSARAMALQVHVSNVTPPPIHYSATFPVVRTSCGRVAPATDEWAYVDCMACLEAAPDVPEAVERLTQLRAKPSSP